MTDRVCVSRRWKVARRGAAGPSAVGPSATVTEPLFAGTLYVADVRFTTDRGTVAVAAADLETVVGFSQKAVGPIAAYASQYGAVELRAGGLLPSLVVSTPQGSYSDAQLQGWVDTLVSRQGSPAASAVLVLNPPGVVNRDARESGGVGVLGYHGLATVPYCFVNLLGSGLALDDRADLYAEAVSHEIAEMTVDPRADDRNPEVCDGCGTNCRSGAAFRAFFDAQGTYVGSSSAFPPSFPYAFFLSAIARPSHAADCPAPDSACSYGPPTATKA